MTLIHCTQKLLREMGLKPSSLTTGMPSSGQLGSWHANLIYIDRKKTVLFVNDKTLFNFIVPSVTRVQLRDLGACFTLWLSCILSDEGFDDPTKVRILSEYRELRFYSSNNRHVLGSMNDLALHYRYFVVDCGGIHTPEVPGIIRKLNRMPFRANKSRYPIELLHDLYAPAT